jgi:hypothetical protein
MADSSFDIVSKIDKQEVDNAINQTTKEISTRFDFRGVGASIARSGDHAIEIRANSEGRASAVLDVFKDKLVKRQVSLKALDHGEPEAAAGGTARLTIKIRQGIDSEKARMITKMIKSDAPKGVQAAVQGDTVRVSSKKRDDLQAVIAMLKAADIGIPLQFENYR